MDPRRQNNGFEAIPVYDPNDNIPHSRLSQTPAQPYYVQPQHPPQQTITPSLSMFQRAVSSVYQRLSPSRNAQSDLSTVPEATEEGSTISSDRMSVSTKDTETIMDGRGGRYHRVHEDDDEDGRTETGEAYEEDDPFADIRRSAGSGGASRVLQYASAALDQEPVQRPPSVWSEASSSIATHSTGSTHTQTEIQPPPQLYFPPYSAMQTPTRPKTNTSEHSSYLHSRKSGSPFDHFKHDAEAQKNSPFARAYAYASGAQPYTSPSRPQRSRSPTPALEDEDCRIENNGSVHHNGPSLFCNASHQHDDEDYEYDEKDALQDDIDIADQAQHYAEHPPAQGAHESDWYQSQVGTLPYNGPTWLQQSQLRKGSSSSSNNSSDPTLKSGTGGSHISTHSRPSTLRPSSFLSGTDGEPTTPITPLTRRHFGPAPIGRVHRRFRDDKNQKLKMTALKRVQLTNGHLVLDLDVPPKLKSVLPLPPEVKEAFGTGGGGGGRRKKSGGVADELGKMRYTAVTCDPDEFMNEGFFLRQNEYGRTIELFIVITMFNEDEILFCRTLYGVMRNISHLCSRKNSRTWGQDAWKKVVVCIVADGRRKVHPRVLDVLTLLGVYQPGDHMKSALNHTPVTAHLFEYTTTFGIDHNLHFKYPDKGVVPTQILFCMKERNQKKINSHRWFFNAFAPLLQPNVCVLLDVGTRPGPKSIYHLWKTFDLNSNVAGACGEIAAYKGKHWLSLLNPLVASQNFEYKITNILDKPMESLFGYISVLPGAFSAYRYIALQNNERGVGPLASYFKGEVLHGRDTDIFTSNMYLAEDRILCFELVAKKNSSWVLKYVKSAIGETDVPDALAEFIIQRRRWLNGSFFAATYAIAHAGQIMRSGHTTGRKVALMAETVYNVINIIASWFAIGNFYLFFVILTSSLENEIDLKIIKYINAGIQYLMAGLVITAFLLSMGNKPKASKGKYKILTVIFAVLMCYMIFCAVMATIKASSQGGGAYSIMIFSLIATYGVYFSSSILSFDPWHMFTSFIPYMLLSPMYINILNVYAFCNLDDISWGTKQDTAVEMDLGAVIQNSNSQVEVEVLADGADANDMYEESLVNLRDRKPLPKPTNHVSNAEREQAAKDYYASVRTNVLLVWVLSNGILLAAILGGGDPTTTFSENNTLTRTKAYMTFILAFVAITSIVRFTGSTMYLIARVFTG